MPLEHQICIHPSVFSGRKEVNAGQSTRHGGVSTRPYASLNLGLYTDDGEERVLENRKRFFQSLGFSEAQTTGGFQVHGDQVLMAEQPGQVRGYDAFISNKKGLLLTVTIADCVPVLLFDPATQSIAAVHAGWKGTAAGIVSRTIEKMQNIFGTNPADCLAYIGTCIEECSFEVDQDVAQHFDMAFKRWDEERQKYYIDLKATNKSLLLKAGLPENQIEISPYCTVVHNQHFFSHRAEKGLTGRMLAAIGMPR